MPVTPLEKQPQWVREALALVNLWGRMGYYYQQVKVSCPTGSFLRVTLHSSREDGGPAPPFYLDMPFPKGRFYDEGSAVGLFLDGVRELQAASDQEPGRRIYEASLIRRAAPQIETKMVAAGLFPPYLRAITVINQGKASARPVVRRGPGWVEE